VAIPLPPSTKFKKAENSMKRDLGFILEVFLRTWDFFTHEIYGKKAEVVRIAERKEEPGSLVKRPNDVINNCGYCMDKYGY